jgi:hypothetical protein
MSERPELTVVGLARDGAAARRLLGDGLGLVATERDEDGVGRATTFRAANGALVVIEPAESGRLGTLLGDAPAAWIGVVVGGAPEDLEGLVRLIGREAGAGGVRLAVGDPTVRVGDLRARVALDHVAFAVSDRDATLAALPHGLDATEPLGRWEFPLLRGATAMVPLRDAYLELNQPIDDDGLFAAAARDGGGRPVFAVLRVDDVEAARDRLVAAGHRVADVEDVLARPEGSGHPAASIGRVGPIPRRECSGLAVMILETRWPWPGPGLRSGVE